MYERYGRPLEADHTGEYVAIGVDGRAVLGGDELELLHRAVYEFGSGNFALRRVGINEIRRVRTLAPVAIGHEVATL